MRYVKLYEQWLNEIDESSSKLDPKKPDTTLVVDISVGDIKQNRADAKNIYASILKKFEFKKDGPLSETSKNKIFEGKIESFIAKGDDNTNYLKFYSDTKLLFSLKNADAKTFGITEWQVDSFNDKESFFYCVGDCIKDGTIKDKTKSFLFTSANLRNDKSSILKSTWYVWLLNEDSNKVQNAVTLGQIGNFIASEFDVSKLLEEGSGNPVNVAKLLGYEIPDNYAPKQGGIKKA